MSVEVIYSDNYKAKMARIRRLSYLVNDIVYGYTKRDIIQIKKNFHDGIKNNTLGLDRLAETTINSKRNKGYQKPTAPLYGKGDREKDRSYSNMLVIRKHKNGWKLEPSRKLHWSRALKLSDLFKIHEHGCTIRQQRGDKSILIKIPPRPALLLSYRRYLIQKRRNKKEQSKEVKRAMTEFINTGNKKKIDIFKKWTLKVESA